MNDELAHGKINDCGIEMRVRLIIYLDKLRFRKYAKIKAYNIEGTVHLEDLVAEGEQVYEMCIRTELDKGTVHREDLVAEGEQYYEMCIRTT
jgi:hypothetical protein